MENIFGLTRPQSPPHALQGPSVNIDSVFPQNPSNATDEQIPCKKFGAKQAGTILAQKVPTP